MTAQVLEPGARLVECRVRPALFALGLADQPEDEIRLVAENRRLDRVGFPQRGGADAFRGERIAGVELEPRQQQLTHRGFARCGPLREAVERVLAETLRLQI